jgi:hypothetical protein
VVFRAARWPRSLHVSGSRRVRLVKAQKVMLPLDDCYRESQVGRSVVVLVSIERLCLHWQIESGQILADRNLDILSVHDLDW